MVSQASPAGKVGFKYNFDITIKNVALSLPGAVKIFVVLKRGEHYFLYYQVQKR